METNKHIRIYTKGDSIIFRSTKSEFGALSNMAGGYPIKIGNDWIYHCESLYQALKYPDYPDIQRKIIFMKSPIFAKKVSRKFEAYQREDWNYVRYKIMKLCIEIKLKNNFRRFSEVLLSTGSLNIVEFTKDDKIWGAVEIEDHYEGINALGRLLMDVREKLRNSSGLPYVIEIPPIDNLRFLGKDLKQYIIENF